jgi:hypothetical protein
MPLRFTPVRYNVSLGAFYGLTLTDTVFIDKNSSAGVKLAMLYSFGFGL